MGDEMKLLETVLWIVLAFWGIELLTLLVLGVRGRAREGRFRTQTQRVKS